MNEHEQTEAVEPVSEAMVPAPVRANVVLWGIGVFVAGIAVGIGVWLVFFQLPQPVPTVPVAEVTPEEEPAPVVQTAVAVEWETADAEGRFSVITPTPPALESLIMESWRQQLKEYGYAEGQEEMSEKPSDIRLERMGHVKEGDYAGADLYRLQWTEQLGIGSGEQRVYVLGQQETWTLLSNYWFYPTFFGWDKQQTDGAFRVSDEFLKNNQISSTVLVLGGLDDPKTVTDPRMGQTFTLDGLVEQAQGASTPFTVKDTQTNQEFSLAPWKHTFLRVRPDGFLATYQMELPWNNDEMAQVEYEDSSREPMARYASRYSSGCGAVSPDVVTTLPATRAGGAIVLRDGTRFPITAPVWTKAEIENEDSEPHFFYQNMQYRQSWGVSNGQEMPELTPEAFLAAHPIFYWTDAYGRVLRFTSENAQSAAECGKPVIYLYPPEQTSVNVQIKPQGGMRVSDPEYKDGWHVVASPDGSLLNKEDGKTYPYLFWEGNGKEYASPEQYWVVTKAEVPVFLRTTLAQIGLNQKEIADFTEFWEPLMQSAPYYKIGFHGTRAMNTLAPLSVQPTPDTVFRVLMDYQELQTREPAKPPSHIAPFVRRGFTVVEWGGVMRH